MESLIAMSITIYSQKKNPPLSSILYIVLRMIGEED
jgi:hypothetical protein